MGYWHDNGLLRKDNNRQFKVAYLLVRGENRIIKQRFKYSDIASEEIVETESNVPFDYDKRTQTIFTSYYWLPFVNGGRIELNGSSKTITSITEVTNADKAERDGKGVIGLNIVLGG